MPKGRPLVRLGDPWQHTPHNTESEAAMTVQVTELSTFPSQQDAQERNDSAYRSTVTFRELPSSGHVAHQATPTSVLVTATDIDVIGKWLFVMGGKITTGRPAVRSDGVDAGDADVVGLAAVPGGPGVRDGGSADGRPGDARDRCGGDPMSVRTVRHLDCEGHALRDDILLCGETVEGLLYENAQDLRRRARAEEGWLRIDGRDLGPECAEAVAR
jgi:hypothetical protein